ncbi:short-chain dehydrogenase/reductase family 9C member 7-like [Cloeon dipterum]|uniref:short-chain dehydrogenase/reductase family 9C member 7-like n=1 Tax=Cloeon dipterum TaxID=197152 RepID=UPI0032205AED
MLSESCKIYLGWFVALASVLWVGISRRLIAWTGTLVISAYLAIWGAAFSSSRRAANFIPNLSKRATFITGCDTGFGFKLALYLNSMGIPVYAGVLNQDSDGAEQLRTKGCKVIEINITNQKSIDEAVEFIKFDLGDDKKLHALVNNAGIAEYGQVEWTSIETFYKVLEVNTFGTIRVTKAFLPLLRLKRGSRVVFTASVAGRYSLPGFSAYSMSKHAIISFADVLRKEMKPFKISVHTIQPTAYMTPLSSAENIGNSLQSHWDKTEPEVKKSYGENYFQTFKTLYLKAGKKLSRTNTSEVVDDMVDAILSKEPKITYIPSLSTKFMVHLLTSIPTEWQDRIMSKSIPDVPPAGLAEISSAHFADQDTEVFV